MDDATNKKHDTTTIMTTKQQQQHDDDCDDTASVSSITPNSIMFPATAVTTTTTTTTIDKENDNHKEEEGITSLSPFHSFDSEEEEQHQLSTPQTTNNNHHNRVIKERELPPRQEILSPDSKELLQQTATTASSNIKTSSPFQPQFYSTKFLQSVSQIVLPKPYTTSRRKNDGDDENNNNNKCLYHSTWIGFWSLLFITCANYVLSPMRDAVALAVGVDRLPQLTLAGTVLAFVSSVPIGWLFEAPDPARRKIFRKMGLTRGETQGTSLALFYRAFSFSLVLYALGFWWVQLYSTKDDDDDDEKKNESDDDDSDSSTMWWFVVFSLYDVFQTLGQVIYICFFLVVHLMKLHSLSLIWGVATEAMEYEDNDNLQNNSSSSSSFASSQPKTVPRLRRLAFMGFGGTLGGIFGSLLASTMAHTLQLSGLLLLAAVLLEIGAELSIELGRIMQYHWERQQILMMRSSSFSSQGGGAAYDGNNTMMMNSSGDLNRVSSFSSMKRVASGNSLHKSNSFNSKHELLQQQQQQNNHQMNNNNNNNTNTNLSSLISSSSSNLNTTTSTTNNNHHDSTSTSNTTTEQQSQQSQSQQSLVENDNTFTQRLLRGITTILRSRLLLAIFTYNALYASTTVLLSFQRAALVAARSDSGVASDTRFLANINMASSLAVFVLQATGTGAHVAHRVGSRGTLSLMPLIRFAGVIVLCWWHVTTDGQPPPLIWFIVLDECTRVMNLAVAKPVRESLWRGLSNEARYEAKPIVDTLANRWGGGSAAFLVSVSNKLLDWLYPTTTTTMREGEEETTKNNNALFFGLPPMLCLCLCISAWWTMVSADLGHVRHKIDVELKKRE